MKTSLYHSDDGDLNIEYIFHRVKTHSDTLIVAFPGGGGDIAGGEWGYLVTIQQLKLNALFLKGNKAINKSRLTFHNYKPAIENAIKALIDQCITESDSKDVIVIGSSMGGWCALYYGLKYNWHIISGSPPYAFGDESVLYATGSIGIESKKWMNNQLLEVMKKAGDNGYNKKIFISFGEGEVNWRLAERGQALIKDLDQANIKYTYKLYPFSNHTTVHTLFPKILNEQISEYLHLDSTTLFQKNFQATSSEVDFFSDLQTTITQLVTFLEDCTLPEPNIVIKNCMHYGNTDKLIGLRNYVYIQAGWYWGGLKNPIKLNHKDAFWCVKRPGEMFSFWFQDSILNACEQENDDNMLQWCIKNAEEYLTYLYENNRENMNWWHAIRRMHFFIALHRLIKEKNLHFNLLWKIPVCVRRDFIRGITGSISVNDYSSYYNRVIALLHITVYFSLNTEIFEKLYNTALDLLNKYNAFYFNNDGCCIFMQTRVQYYISKVLYQIMYFIQENYLPETKTFLQLKKQYQKITAYTSHMICPNNRIAALGHSVYEISDINKWLPRNPTNFIKPMSNIAFLEDAQSLSYITVNGGQNIRSAYRHCDLLSFTWFYDGVQIFRDTEGGNDILNDFACSAIAHNAFICDDANYITPNYSDWTTINNFIEDEKYVLINMSHYLIDGVVMQRTLIWIKPNVIILKDHGYSDAEHLFTQNFILNNFNVNKQDKYKVNISIKHGFETIITQYQQNDNFQIQEYYGTNDIEDKQNFRGSSITSWKKLEKKLNLVYSKKTQNAQFLTAIECHSPAREGKAQEYSVQQLVYENNQFVVSLDDGTELKITEKSIAGLA